MSLPEAKPLTVASPSHPMERHNLAKRAVCEGIGTAMLLATVVGSGIMAEELSAGNVALALLANALATGAGLIAIILTFGSISGAHLNPLVSLSEALLGRLPRRELAPYLLAQLLGAFAGVALAHGMFHQPLFAASEQVRAGAPLMLGEFIASFGLISVVLGCAQKGLETTAIAVGAYITAAYWFTSSTSFANPAVTLARAATDTFAGIRPMDTPGFIVAQLLGAGAATLLFRWLSNQERRP